MVETTSAVPVLIAMSAKAERQARVVSEDEGAPALDADDSDGDESVGDGAVEMDPAGASSAPVPGDSVVDTENVVGNVAGDDEAVQ